MTVFNSSLPDDRLPELHALASASLSGEPSDEEIARLEQLVCEDPELCKLYVRYMYISWNLKTWAKYPLPDDAETQLRPLSQDADVVPLKRLTDSVPIGLQTPPRLGFLGSAYHGTAAFFSQELPLTWLITTVIMGVAMLGAWAYKVPIGQHLAEAPSQSVPSDARPEMVFVGRITGMVDVKWSDDKDFLPPLGYAYVPLGRKYILDAGLMEITYDTGAKVILQGPCTYEVESTAGGYLTLGKLTAKVEEERSAVRSQRSDHYSLSTIHYPLFSVRTPAATITDLGTEFGVEVCEEGCTTSHVFCGSVKVLVSDGTAGSPGSGCEVILRENESARVEHGKDGKDAAKRLVIVRGPAVGKKAGQFVRSLPSKPAAAPRSVAKSAGPGFGVGAVFEQNPLGRYINVDGAAVYQEPPWASFEGRQSRGYLHTAATDFCNRDFTFEATFQVQLDASFKTGDFPEWTHRIFFGVGDGVPNPSYFDEVRSGLVLMFVVENGTVSVRLYHPDPTATPEADDDKWMTELVSSKERVPADGQGAGRHRFRMSKSGKWVTFAVDRNFTGQFHADFTSPPIDLPATAPLLNATNSRLLVGTGYCDTMTVSFEELSVTFPKSDVPAASQEPGRKEGTFMD